MRAKQTAGPIGDKKNGSIFWRLFSSPLHIILPRYIVNFLPSFHVLPFSAKNLSLFIFLPKWHQPIPLPWGFLMQYSYL
jgi:hypothetical protein